MHDPPPPPPTESIHYGIDPCLLLLLLLLSPLGLLLGLALRQLLFGHGQSGLCGVSHFRFDFVRKLVLLFGVDVLHRRHSVWWQNGIKGVRCVDAVQAWPVRTEIGSGVFCGGHR